MSCILQLQYGNCRAQLHSCLFFQDSGSLIFHFHLALFSDCGCRLHAGLAEWLLLVVLSGVQASKLQVVLSPCFLASRATCAAGLPAVAHNRDDKANKAIVRGRLLRLPVINLFWEINKKQD